MTERERFFQAVLDRAPFGVVVSSTRVDGEISYVNPEFTAIVGYTIEDVPTVDAWLHRAYPDPSYRETILQNWSGDVDPAQQKRDVVYRAVCKDGTQKEIQLRASPMADDQMVVLLLDVTRQRETEARLDRVTRERQELQGRMLQTQKLESLGILAGGIAHEFNNLLLGIMGNVDMVLMDLPSGSPVRPCVTEIESASRRAAELTRQMLAYSGQSRFVVEPVDLGELVKDMGQLLEVAVSKKTELEVSTAEKVPLVEGDRAQLRQVLMNLVTNAAEALQGGRGKIAITTGVQQCGRSFLENTYVDDNLPAGEYVFVAVTDTGSGMDDATRERIFDPFFTTKFTGRGLGLAAVLGIARGHRGAVRVDTVVGQGTCVKLLLPVMERDRRTAPPRRATPREDSGTTVLLVDDDLTVQKVGTRMLQRMGLGVEVASDGIEAVKRLEEDGGGYCCVLLDLTMPRMDGIETMHELSRLCPDVPVVLSSGYSEAEVKERFTEHGFAGFIQKPYRFARLEQVIRRLRRDPG